MIVMNAVYISKLFIIILMHSTCAIQAVRCPREGKCFIQLQIEPRLTMMNGKMRVRPCNGRLCDYNKETPLDPSIEETIITTDGVYARLVISVNGTVPGPEIIAYENQQLEILVTNKLHTDSVTIHFHGAHQVNTPFMDGVAFVTQCPIYPGNTFNYTFKATPHGTHWYHAHIGDQRSMGLYGPYIVLKRNEPITYDGEHILTLQDWNHDMDPETAYQKMLNGVYSCTLIGDSCIPYVPTESVDGAKFSIFQFQSGLINGKGRYYINGLKIKHNNAPLTSFAVESNKLYRFRVISAATLYPFRVRVSGHKLTMVASDGRDIQPVEVESFIINTGERMDFILNTTRSRGSYMIVAETLEVISNAMFHGAEAILNYENETVTSAPSIAPVKCTEFPGGKCPVFNCPFLYYPKAMLIDCITFHEVRGKIEEVPDDYSSVISATADKTFFLNFAFPGTNGITPGSVNGRQYVEPSVNSYAQPQEVGPACSNQECGRDKICECAYTINIEAGQIIDMVFLNMGVGKGWSHPVHLHGHSFYVVAMGFPEYDINTGKIVRQNTAVDCRGAYCNNAGWAGRGRERRQISDEEAKNIRPLKDTIIVPTHGYVIIRFKADNPGLWFLHCHIDLHNTNGMAMMVNESFSQHPVPPKSMPRCRNYLDENSYRFDQPFVCIGNVSSSTYAYVILLCVASILIP